METNVNRIENFASQLSQNHYTNGWWIAMVPLVIFAILIGSVAATGDLLIIGFLVVTVAIIFLATNPGALLWISVLGGLIVSGLMELYLPNLQIIRWAFAGAAILLPIAAVIHNMRPTTVALSPMPALFYWGMAFLLLCLVTTTINWHSVGQAVFGWKSYFQVWGLLIGLALLRQTPSLFNSLPKSMLLIGLIQLPFALQQFLFLAPQRVGMQHGIVPVDIVAGTFGASLTGGGSNAALAVFQIILASVILSLWRTGALRRFWVLPLAGILLVPIFINESKISVIYTLLSYLIIFWPDVVKRPLRFIAVFGFIASMALGLILSYGALHESGEDKSPMALVEHVIEQNTQQGIGYGIYSLNRTTSLSFWAQEQHRYGLASTLLGHGLGESRDEQTVLGLSQSMAVTRYAGMGIGLTSVTSLLWDVGILGLLLMLGMFISAYRLAGKLSSIHADSPWQSGWYKGIQGGIAILTLGLAHNNFIVYHFEFQTFVLFVMGYLIHVARHIEPEQTRVSAIQRTSRAFA